MEAVRAWEARGEMGRHFVKDYKFPVMRGVSSRDLRNSVVTRIDKTVLTTGKLLKE